MKAVSRFVFVVAVVVVVAGWARATRPQSRPAFALAVAPRNGAVRGWFPARRSLCDVPRGPLSYALAGPTVSERASGPRVLRRPSHDLPQLGQRRPRQLLVPQRRRHRGSRRNAGLPGLLGGRGQGDAGRDRGRLPGAWAKVPVVASRLESVGWPPCAGLHDGARGRAAATRARAGT